VTSENRTPVVGIIGLGQIGGGMAGCLAKTGQSIVVYDVLPASVEPYRGAATIALSPAEVATRSDVVLIAVVSADQVHDVLSGAQGLLSAPKRSSVVAVCSTISVAAVLSFAELAAENGVALLDCGVTGGRAALKNGSLVCLVGGEKTDVDRIRPALDGFSKLVLHMGPLGSGIKTKLARNLITYGTFLAAYEGQSIARQAGLDLAKLAEAIRASDEQLGGINNVLKVTTGPIDEADEPDRYREAVAFAALARKDLRAASELARELGVAAPVAKLAEDLADDYFGVAPRT
jgi:3-hydroxyisobutyrate dehydrogenase